MAIILVFFSLHWFYPHVSLTVFLTDLNQVFICQESRVFIHHWENLYLGVYFHFAMPLSRTFRLMTLTAFIIK